MSGIRPRAGAHVEDVFAGADSGRGHDPPHPFADVRGQLDQKSVVNGVERFALLLVEVCNLFVGVGCHHFHAVSILFDS